MILSSLAVATTSSFFAVPISYYVIEELKLDAAATNIAQQMIQLPQALQVVRKEVVGGVGEVVVGEVEDGMRCETYMMLTFLCGCGFGSNNTHKQHTGADRPPDGLCAHQEAVRRVALRCVGVDRSSKLTTSHLSTSTYTYPRHIQHHRRRKYYILAGWLMYIVAMAALAGLGEPNVDALIGLCFLSFFGAQLLDLAQRALIVQRSRYETEVGA